MPPLSECRNGAVVPDFRGFARRLGKWFERHQRDMTWRRTRDPYAIWVSEVMLQQTRVETVERYYADFMDRFPTVGALAAADEQQVLKAWSGLGYYRRARMLHAGARAVAERYDARMPTSAVELRQIPGIGPYTAGAIVAIAYDHPEALVDGNVARVLSRVGAIKNEAAQAATATGHWRTVAEILACGSPRVLAQALMELGAIVCTPRNPTCATCPVRQDCGAFAQQVVDRIPAPRRRGPLPAERWWALVIRDSDDRTLLIRRPAKGLLAGLWCVPLIHAEEDVPPSKFSGVELGSNRSATIRVTSSHVSRVTHVFTHRRWNLGVVRCAAGGRHRASRDDAQWFVADDLPEGGLPALTSKILAASRGP